MAIKQSFSWWCFQGRGVEAADLLSQAKQIGYSAVELIGPELFLQVHDCGLTISAHGGHDSIGCGLNDPAEHDRIEREINEALALAVKWNISNLIVFSGNRRAGVGDEEAAEHAAAGLRRVAGAAEDAGVTLVMELLNSRVDHPQYQCDSTAWGISVCRAVASPQVKLLYDIYHMQIMEGDIIARIGQNHEFFAHYHTAGVPGRHDLDDQQELNYAAIVRAIAATGYTGYLGHEFVPKADPVAALQAAYQLCDGA